MNGFRRFVVASALTVSCGATPAPPPRPIPRAKPAARVDDDWVGESWEERHDVMTFAVLPNMARLFQKFEGKPDPDMTCRTCHGEDAEAVAYRMPHGLPALDPEHLPSAGDPDARRAKWAKFMRDVVVPRMRDLVGDPELSCFSCHPAGSAPR